MKKLISILVALVGLILTLGALDIYAVPQSDTIVAIAVLVVGVILLIKDFKG